MDKTIKTDVAIIGAGITGCAIARQLGRYKLKTIVIDKEADVGWGTTKANSGFIHPGYAGIEGTLRLSLCHRGSILYKDNAGELGIPIRNIGSLLNVFHKEQVSSLEQLLKQGKKYGVGGLEIITNKNDALKKLEPNIGDKVIAALYSKIHYQTSPYEAAIALYENAKANSVDFQLSSKVTGIKFDKLNKIFHIDVSRFDTALNSFINHEGLIQAAYIVNAGGVFADEIAALIGDNSFGITAIKGQYFLFDNEVTGIAKKLNIRISDLENVRSKGMLVAPTMADNLYIGSNYEKTTKTDTTTTKPELEEIMKKQNQMIKNIPFDKVIATFAGIRAYGSTGDFILGQSSKNIRFINAAGIQSPGLTCSFIIAEIIIEKLKSAGLKLKKNNMFNPQRKCPQKLNKEDYIENNKLYGMNKSYGEIVCRCEKIPEAEILDAIRNGATTLDGIKFRTRAGMGRCQGGYCTLRIMKIISKELGIPFNMITKKGDNSFIATKEVS